VVFEGAGPELVPTEPHALAKSEQAASIEYSQFNPIASTKLFKLRLGRTTNEALVNEFVPRLQNRLDGYEATFPAYVVQEVGYNIVLMCSFLLQEVTFADLFHLPCGSTIFEDLNIVLDGRPNLQR
jgi:glutathione S-transferase